MDLEPEVRMNPFEISPILIVKNVDFIIEASTFHVEEYFENIDWVSVATREQHAYPRLMKDFYKNIGYCSLFEWNFTLT